MDDDYERANAHTWDLHLKENKKPEVEWQEVVGPKKSNKPQQPQQRPQPQKPVRAPEKSLPPPPWHQEPPRQKQNRPPRRPPPRMIQHSEDGDNEAQESWRRHEPATQVIRIPEHLALLEDRMHEKIAAQNGTFILTEHSKSSSGSLTFGIWGETAAATATRQAINQWIEDFTGKTASNRAAKFAKVQSQTERLRTRNQHAWEREVRRAKFRQYPPPGTFFGAIGSFHWPVAEYRPEEILGKSYEALDPIRMDHKCYVLFAKEASTFKIMAYSQQNVGEALLRLRKVCFQIAARQIPPIRLYLLHWPDAITLPSHVYLESYDHPSKISREGAPDTQGQAASCPRGEGVEDESEAEVERQTVTSEERVRSAVLYTLSHLHYYHSNIHMRIRLGTFLATQFRKLDAGLYELEEYESMTEQSQFAGRTTQELGDKDLEQAALSILQEANDILVPQDAITSKLADVKPIYSAVFIFGDEKGDLRLTIAWKEEQDTASDTLSFEVVFTKFCRLERDTGTASPILDINLTDLNTGLAWHFDLQAAQAVDEFKLPKGLSDFARNVGINATALRHGIAEDTSFILFKPYAVNLKSMQQRISCRYNIGSSDYTLELTRFQDRVFPSRKATFMPAEPPTVYEPRWSVEVYRMEWDTMFAMNERLDVGTGAAWNHDVETWFPEDWKEEENDGPEGCGFSELMEKLKAVRRLLRASAVDDSDLMKGMTVG